MSDAQAAASKAHQEITQRVVSVLSDKPAQRGDHGKSHFRGAVWRNQTAVLDKMEGRHKECSTEDVFFVF